MGKLIDFLKGLSYLLNPRHWGPFTEIALLTRFDHAASVSWSQGGEDLALLHIFSGVKDGSYLDVGAHHPDRFSVTRHLYQQGWKGVNVEANPELINNFIRKRNRDVNLNFAVGTEKQYELTIFKESAISTVNRVWREKFLTESNQIESCVQLNGVSLRKLLDTYFPNGRLDLLTVDAEGSDLNVLQSMNFETLPGPRFPRYLLLEANPPVEAALEVDSVKYACSLGYKPVLVLTMSVLLEAQHR